MQIKQVVLFSPDKPENVQLQTSTTNNKAYKGKTISFNCSADAVPSVTSYQLLENGTPIIVATSTGRWTQIFRIGVFIYQCVAKNTLGTGDSANVTVSVNGKENDKIFASITVQFLTNKVFTEGLA